MTPFMVFPKLRHGLYSMTENFDKEIFAKIHSLKLLAEIFLKICDFVCEFVTICYRACKTGHVG